MPYLTHYAPRLSSSEGNMLEASTDLAACFSIGR
jgi:hypothetical protein